METINLTSVKKELTVEASQQTAFEVFTQKMGLWWPATHHIGTCAMTDLVAENKTGGRWYSKHEDGSEAEIGYVVTYDPYNLLVLGWQVNGDFKFDADLITEVRVQFIRQGPNTTLVKMEHNDMHKLGGSKLIESMDQGWGMIMELYKKQAEL